MSVVQDAHGTYTIWRVLLLAQWREQPARLLVTIVAIALGVSLGTAVYLINNAALNEFGLATRKLVGEVDIVVRSPQAFSEQLLIQLANDAAVGIASPVLELDVALPGQTNTLKVLGVDPFRAAALQPALINDIGSGSLALFEPDSIYLSSRAAQELHMRRGDMLKIIVGSSSKTLHVLGVLSPNTYSQALGLMDIASAQWTFNRIGLLNRIDLRLKSGHDVDAFRHALGERLPVGVLAIAPRVEIDRAIAVTRAYRVNLNMLALVALITGAFLVYATQSLSVQRRLKALALFRALGVTRRQLRWALIFEGTALGMIGSSLGIILGLSIATMVLDFLSGDLGNGQLHAIGASMRAAPLPILAFFVMGTAVASMGVMLPARTAAKWPPARALKGGDGDYSMVIRTSTHVGILLVVIGATLSQLPSIGGLPIFGYASIAALLFGAVSLVPTLTQKSLRLMPRTGRIVIDTAMTQLRDNIGLSTLSLASIIVSFSLMVAMAIMVYSFRVSFDHWLGKLLPADVQLREPLGNDTAYWSRADQTSAASTPGISRIEFRRTQQLLLDPARPPVTLIARGSTAVQAAQELPLVQTNKSLRPPHSEPAWISEALQAIYGYQLGDQITLPLAGRLQHFTIDGIWRDYARSMGAIVISRQAYIAATGDNDANEGSVWLMTGDDASAVETALRKRIGHGDSIEILTSTALRERSLQIFDRAFAVTYALEAIAVVIGLLGVSFTASSTALARRAEFGMLRHIGMLRRQIIGMLASEGILTSAFGVVYGLVLGAALSLVLVYVINRQSFNWSIDIAIPIGQLTVLSLTLIVAAAMTAIWSGRAALSRDAVHAVREDW